MSPRNILASFQMDGVQAEQKRTEKMEWPGWLLLIDFHGAGKSRHL